ncbi:MAG: carboxylating nicotinate-nucleotide diphosphorylase [Planctomycetota bacterium]
MELDPASVREHVRRALDEDLRDVGDLTTRLSVPTEARGRARILAREAGVLAGLPVALECLRATDEAVQVELRAEDGQDVAVDDIVLAAEGTAAGLLAAERTALNFLQRLSGIATATRALVTAVSDTGLRVYDTRKTTPGLRAFEKYAVRVGGGCNHRFGLFDQVLLKENHFALAAPRSYADVVRGAVAGSTAPVVAEARNREEALAAVDGGAAIILLDNLAPGPELRALADELRSVARQQGREVEVEASGGVRAANVRAFAESGVDRVSVGALTHTVRALDLSMLIEVAA